MGMLTPTVPHSDRVTTVEMGDTFDALIQTVAGQSKEGRGEWYTPRDVSDGESPSRSIADPVAKNPLRRPDHGRFFDRFLLRFDVGYLLVASNLRGVLVGPEPAIAATLTMDELRRAQVELAQLVQPRTRLLTLRSLAESACLLDG
jgi:hypothetical protein